jgi:hypothetical protein
MIKMLMKVIRKIITWGLHKPLRNDIFNGTMLNMDAIEICFFLIIAKREGYYSFRVKFPNHLSSQNVTFYPLHN